MSRRAPHDRDRPDWTEPRPPRDRVGDPTRTGSRRLPVFPDELDEDSEPDVDPWREALGVEVDRG